MLVQKWMAIDVKSVSTGTSMNDAVKLMQNHHIRILPVMKSEKILGVVTDLDIKRASSSNATLLEAHELQYLISKLKIKEIMNAEPITIPMDHTIGEAAEIMLQNRIAGLPVVDPDRKLVGIITQTDIFKALISMTGTDRKGIQMAFQVSDRPGSIKQLTDIIRKNGGRLLSILTSYDRAPEGYRNLYIRAFALNRRHLPRLREEMAAHGNFYT